MDLASYTPTLDLTGLIFGFQVKPFIIQKLLSQRPVTVLCVLGGLVGSNSHKLQLAHP